MTEHQDDTLWQAYYAKVANREPRALFQRLMGALPPGDTPGLAIDLGCGDGTETLALLAAGWRVLALDGAPAAIATVPARPTLTGSKRNRLPSPMLFCPRPISSMRA